MNNNVIENTDAVSVLPKPVFASSLPAASFHGDEKEKNTGLECTFAGVLKVFCVYFIRYIK